MKSLLKGVFHFCSLDSGNSLTASCSIATQTGVLTISHNSPNKNRHRIQLIQTKNNVTKVFAVKKESVEEIDFFSTDFSIDDFRNYISKVNKDSTIVIWSDEDQGTLSIARDPFGVIPLYFFHDVNKKVIFSTHVSSVKNLLDDIPANSEVNDNKVRSYLSLSSISAPYTTDTFFPQIQSVLPGHFVTFKRDEFNSYSYVSFNPEKYHGLSKLPEFGSVFRQLFIESVGNAIKDRNVIGMQLSGGLDSSSVAVVAQSIAPSIPKHTFFFDIPSSTAIEKEFSNAVASDIQSHHHLLTPSYKYINEAYELIKSKGEPLFMIGAMGMPSLSMEKAASLNCDIFLTGHDGDSIIGNGKKYITSLFQNKNWAELNQAAEEYSHTNNLLSISPDLAHLSSEENKIHVLRNLFLKQFKNSLVSYSVKNALKILSDGYSNFKISPIDLLIAAGDSIVKRRIVHRVAPKNILRIRPDSDHIERKSISFADTLRGNNLQYHKDILYNQNVWTNEDYFTFSEYYKINICHPFFDKDLYELCLSVPEVLRFNHGYTRGPLREALKGLLPEAVRTRTTKANFIDYAIESVLILNRQAQDFLTDPAPVWEIVNRSTYLRFVKLLESPSIDKTFKASTYMLVQRTIYLAIWLDLLKRNDFALPNYDFTIDFKI